MSSNSFMRQGAARGSEVETHPRREDGLTLEPSITLPNPGQVVLAHDLADNPATPDQASTPVLRHTSLFGPLLPDLPLDFEWQGHLESLAEKAQWAARMP